MKALQKIALMSTKNYKVSLNTDLEIMCLHKKRGEISAKISHDDKTVVKLYA